MDRAEKEVEVIVLKRIHLYVGLLAAVVVPVLTASATYHSSIEAVNQRINEVQIDSAKNLVTKEDLAEIKSSLNQINAEQRSQGEDLARIKGILERRR